MESSITIPTSTVAKKMLSMLRVVYRMIRRGVMSKQKLAMDLLLHLKRLKIAGKAVANLMAFNHHHYSAARNPREAEFSCGNTPSYARKNRLNDSHDFEAAAAIAKAFELLNNNTEIFFSDAESIPPSIAPSPMIVGFGKNPRMVRQLRVTDSPYPIKEDEVADDGRVDKEADEFIKRFYEQLKIQPKSAVATPDYKLRQG